MYVSSLRSHTSRKSVCLNVGDRFFLEYEGNGRLLILHSVYEDDRGIEIAIVISIHEKFTFVNVPVSSYDMNMKYILRSIEEGRVFIPKDKRDNRFCEGDYVSLTQSFCIPEFNMGMKKSLQTICAHSKGIVISLENNFANVLFDKIVQIPIDILEKK